MNSDILYMPLPTANSPMEALENAPGSHAAVVLIEEPKRMIPLDVAQGPLTAQDLNKASGDSEGIDIEVLRRVEVHLKWLTTLACYLAFATLAIMVVNILSYISIFSIINIPIGVGVSVWCVISAVFAVAIARRPDRLYHIFWGAIPTLVISCFMAIFCIFSNVSLMSAASSLLIVLIQVGIIVVARKPIPGGEECCC